ncbi:hypothetical protein QYE76_005532 [Lolium multiflorum]|uniref:Rx N-terminal domain-containing protein n=1 Tax=Lolium multiflorum TaxID=4521 RepID=A0AAD8W192_LOLMU|nr:hypothetical protein QYE76_005532 [Lolium multiflorum]
MSPVLRKLGELLLDEYNLGKKVKKGVQSLLTELELMHAALRKVGDVPSDQLDEQVVIWAGKVRDLSYEMEDVVDDFLVRVDEGSSGEPMTMKSRVKKFLKKTRKLFSKGRALHQISGAIQEAQGLAKELAELHTRYQIDMTNTSNGATTSNGTTIDPRVIALHKDVEKLVGIDRARNDLIKILIGEDGSPKEQLMSISIVGVGGLGKTTLTKAVYEKIKAQFDCAAFVPVGQKPDIKKVFKDILYGFDKEKFKDVHNTTRDEKLLIEEIGEFLVDKRNRRTLTRPSPPRPTASVSLGTELATTSTQLPRPQGVRRIAARDNNDETMVQLFTEEQNAEVQQLILTSLPRVRHPLFAMPRRGGSNSGKRRNINRHRQAGGMLLDADYFADDVTHSPKEFRRRFMMNKDLFMKIVYGVREYDEYFMDKQDCTARKDVQHAFGVLQQRFAVVSVGAPASAYLRSAGGYALTSAASHDLFVHLQLHFMLPKLHMQLQHHVHVQLQLHVLLPKRHIHAQLRLTEKKRPRTLMWALHFG